MIVVWMRGSRSIAAKILGVPFSNLNAKAVADPNARVRGRIAKMCLPRYRAIRPNIGLRVTRGQFPTSASSAADHAFISSEM